MKHIYIILFGFLFISNLNAQVNIGSAEKPEPFSVLQLEDSRGGLRFPRLNDVMKNQLNITPAMPLAQGLMFYNTTDNLFNYWNGTEWIKIQQPILASVTGENGLIVYNNKLGLGGYIEKATTINIDKWSLNFPLTIKDSKTGKMNIGSQLTVTLNGVGIGLDEPQAALDIYSTTEGEGMQIVDPTIREGYILSADANGVATPAPLRPMAQVVGSVKQGYTFQEIMGSTNIASAQVSGSKYISNVLNLPAGQWLVVGKITTGRRFVNIATAGLYVYATLCIRENDAWVNVNKSGSTTETAGAYIATPQFVHYLNLTESTDIILRAETSHTRTYMCSSFGGSYFYAIRLDGVAE